MRNKDSLTLLRLKMLGGYVSLLIVFIIASCIIVTKSYLYKDDDDNFAIDEKGLQKLQEIKHIPIYRIQKREGFDKKDQSTIETVVTPLF